MKHLKSIAAAAALCAAAAAPALAQTVKITPLGGFEGEFCPQDRALVFEDPNAGSCERPTSPCRPRPTPAR